MRISRIAIALLALAGCPGSRTLRDHDVRDSPGNGKANIPAIRALLDRYSPTASWVLRTEDSVPRQFVFGRSTLTLTSSGDFASYFDDGAVENLAPYTSTAVHEMYHALSHRLGYQLQAEARVAQPVDSEGFYISGAPQLVRYTIRYPAREMAETFPPDARAFRFPTYVSPSSAIQGTQVDGVYGLLDEWAAYFHGSRTLVDLWPWIRDEAPRSREVYVKYRGRVFEIGVPHAEFKLFILHYLWHAKTHRPDVYRAVLANESFRHAFREADDAWSALLAEAAALEPAMVAIASERGAGNITFHRDAAYPNLLAHIASTKYQEILVELRRD